MSAAGDVSRAGATDREGAAGEASRSAAAGRGGAEGRGLSTGRSKAARLRPHVRQFVKFSMVGGSGVLVNLAVFNLTMLVWHLLDDSEPLAAKYVANLLGFVVSVLSNYYLNRHWTFRSSGDVRRELPKFFTVSVIAYFANLAVFTVCLTQLHIAPNPSQLIAIAAVMPVNYLLNKLWSFRGA